MKALQEKFHLPVLIVICLFLGFFRLGYYDFHIDEYATISIASGIGTNDNNYWVEAPAFRPATKVFTSHNYWSESKAENVVKYTILDNGNSFLFNLTLFSWLKMVDPSVFNFRILSLLFYLGSCVLLYFLTINISGSKKIAFVASILLAIHPIVVHYAHLARGYEMALFFSLLATFALVSVFDKEKVPFYLYILYPISILFSLLSHYLTLPVFIGHGLYILYQKDLFKKKLFYGLSFLLVFSLFLVHLDFIGMPGKVIMDKQDALILQNSSEQVKTGISSIIQGSIQQFLGLTGNYFQFMGFRLREIAIMGLIPLLYLLLNWKGLYEELKKKKNSLPVFLLVSLFVFATFSAVKAGHTTSFYSRYGLFFIPYMMILFGIVFEKIQYAAVKRFSLILFAGIVVIMLFSLASPLGGVFHSYFDKPVNIFEAGAKDLNENKFEVMTAEINRSYSPGDTLVFNNWFDAHYVNLLKLPEIIPQTVDTSNTYNVILKNSENIKTIR